MPSCIAICLTRISTRLPIRVLDGMERQAAMWSISCWARRCWPCPIRKRTGLGWSILSLITWVILESMLRCSAVYLTGMYGAMGGARAIVLPLPYFIQFSRKVAISLEYLSFGYFCAIMRRGYLCNIDLKQVITCFSADYAWQGHFHAINMPLVTIALPKNGNGRGRLSPSSMESRAVTTRNKAVKTAQIHQNKKLNIGRLHKEMAVLKLCGP